MPSHQNRNGIPDRWLEYQNVGKRIPGTRFVSFKVPLKQALNRNLRQSEVFGPWELLDALEKQKEELGLIIDLTFTTRYYKLEDIPDSMLCLKILTAGHAVPDDTIILSFKQAVHGFLQDNKDNDKLIGVHCRHGLNRSGYLVCRYLIDVEGVDPKKAIELFNSSRGHAIERKNYLHDLQSGPKRSNTGMEECEQKAQRGRAVCRPSDNHTEDRAERHTPRDWRDGHGPREQTGWRHSNQPPHPRRSPPPTAPRSHMQWGAAHPRDHDHGHAHTRPDDPAHPRPRGHAHARTRPDDPARPRDHGHAHTRPDDPAHHHHHPHGHAHNQGPWGQPFYVAEQNGRPAAARAPLGPTAPEPPTAAAAPPPAAAAAAAVAQQRQEECPRCVCDAFLDEYLF